MAVSIGKMMIQDWILGVLYFQETDVPPPKDGAGAVLVPGIRFIQERL